MAERDEARVNSIHSGGLLCTRVGQVKAFVVLRHVLALLRRGVGTRDGMAGRAGDHGKQPGFPIRHETREIICPQEGRIHRVRSQILIERIAGDGRRILPASLQSLQVDRRRDAPEDAVGLVAERGLVDDGVEDLGLDLLLDRKSVV